MDNNWAALCVAILTTNTIEESLELIFKGKVYGRILTEEDTEDMKELKKQGLTYDEIGEIYNISKSGVCRRLKYQKAVRKVND